MEWPWPSLLSRPAQVDSPSGHPGGKQSVFLSLPSLSLEKQWGKAMSSGKDKTIIKWRNLFFYGKAWPNSLSQVPDYPIMTQIKLYWHNLFVGDGGANVTTVITTVGDWTPWLRSGREGEERKRHTTGQAPFHFFVGNHAHFAKERSFHGDALLLYNAGQWEGKRGAHFLKTHYYKAM